MISKTPENIRETLTDGCIVDFLRRQGTCSINDLVEFAGVTPTAIRLRLNRLMDQGLVVRQAEERASRGRPTYEYSLSKAGERSGGNNYADLANILWQELRSIKDVEVRTGLLKRLVERITEVYQGQVEGTEIRKRMESLAGLMAERDIPFEVKENQQGLPVLTALACPYPDLAEQDRGICAMEKMLFN